MATLRQIEASRINGAGSRGPVTPEGKARVSQNGAKHGIYSQLVVLHNEDHSMYMESRDRHLAEWGPSTESEHNLVIDIVDARWRLRRFSTLETAALDFEVERMRPEMEQTFSEIDEGTRTVLAFNTLLVSNRTFEVLQTAIRAQHRIIERATNQLIRLARLRELLQPQSAPVPTEVASEKPATVGPQSPSAGRSPENPEVKNYGSKPGQPVSRIPDASKSGIQTRPHAVNRQPSGPPPASVPIW